MSKIIESNELYYIIELKGDYKKWIGIEKYAVVTDLEPEYIEMHFADALNQYKPYLFLNSMERGITMNNRRIIVNSAIKKIASLEKGRYLDTMSSR